jgi:hypothetical protein
MPVRCPEVWALSIGALPDGPAERTDSESGSRRVLPARPCCRGADGAAEGAGAEVRAREEGRAGGRGRGLTLGGGSHSGVADGGGAALGDHDPEEGLLKLNEISKTFAFGTTN